MREVPKAADAGVPRAVAAVTAYRYRVWKAIGACVAGLGGLDAVVFTAGIGQGSDRVLAVALEASGVLGIRLDDQRNRNARGFDEICWISADDSPVAVLVVPTNEERMMAGEALRAVGRAPG
jgi:acetate kinase